MHMDMDARLAASGDRRNAISRLIAKVRAILADRSDTAVAQKVAGSAFLIRVVNAGIAFASQILLARWMGQNEYGIYVYVWTWVLLLGGLTSFGLASAPQRFIPEYGESGRTDLLRGFLRGSRLLSVATSTIVAALGVAGIWLFSDKLDNAALIALYLAMVCVPIYVLTDVQDGISRSYNWIDVALAPAYFVRPLLILGLLAGLSLLEYAPTATTAMTATVIATWATSVAQFLMLGSRLKKRVPAGPHAYAPKTWMKVSLPIFMVEGFYLLLAYTDVLVLSAFRPAHDVAVYYAAVKVMSLVAFVSFSVSAAVAHRFTEYAVSGEQERLAAMVRDAARWTFWPSLAGCAVLLCLGWPILWLFGADFTDGYPLLFVISIGLLARATVGPLERLLNMLGQQNICAAVYGGAFALNLALCLLLAPRFGMMGVASATAVTMVVESILLFWVTRRRLGLGVMPWGREPELVSASGDAVTDAFSHPTYVAEPVAPAAERAAPYRFELVTVDELARSRAAWEDLAERALERNLFCEADFAIAAKGLIAVRTVRLAAVWDETAPEPRLIAVAPVARFGQLPFPAMKVSAHWAFFGALGAPLIDAELAPLAVEKLLDGLASQGSSVFMFRFLPERGPVADAIRAAVAFTGRETVRIEAHGRAMLRSGESAESYLTASLSAKKLKEYRRQLRRLGDEAPTNFREARRTDEVADALERFLELEDKGWKGKGGTAMRRHADQLAFIRELSTKRAEKREVRILELFAGERLVASGLLLVSGRRAWFYKVAYDESFARCSPGVQLTLELTRRLIEDDGIDMVDSTAIANHPMIDHIWRDRLQLGDWLVAIRPGARRLLEPIARIERARRRARLAARDIYRRLRK